MKTIEITLTVAEILDLARATGFCPKDTPVCDEEDLQTEFTLVDREGGYEIDYEDGEKPKRHRLVAYITEYPEEGTYPLGEPIQ